MTEKSPSIKQTAERAAIVLLGGILLTGGSLVAWGYSELRDMQIEPIEIDGFNDHSSRTHVESISPSDFSLDLEQITINM